MANSITKDPGRQEKKFAYVDFTHADINGTTFTPAITLPAGSVATGGALTVTAGFGALNTADIGDAGSGNRYGNDVAVSSTGRTALVPTGHTNTGSTDLGLTFASAPTAGAGRLEVEYYTEGRATSTQD